MDTRGECNLEQPRVVLGKELVNYCKSYVSTTGTVCGPERKTIILFTTTTAVDCDDDDSS